MVLADFSSAIGAHVLLATTSMLVTKVQQNLRRFTFIKCQVFTADIYVFCKTTVAWLTFAYKYIQKRLNNEASAQD